MIGQVFAPRYILRRIADLDISRGTDVGQRSREITYKPAKNHNNDHQQNDDYFQYLFHKDIFVIFSN